MDEPSHPSAKPVKLRVGRELLSIIDRASALHGRTREEFIIDASHRAANHTICDQKVFLDREAFDSFDALLDRPPQPNDRLREMMRKIPLWKKG